MVPTMKYLDLTLPSPQQNLACDEALLDLCEDGYEHDLLRFWEPREHFVVLGYSSRISSDVKLLPCRQARIPIVRRCSGGGTVLQGPGCLNFSLVLRMESATPLQTIRGTTGLILQRHQHALEPIAGRPMTIEGFSDLAIGGLKCSGSAQRRKRRCVLFHGTFLLDFDIRLVERVLAMPVRQPPYREHRSHREFLINLKIPARTVKKTLASAWSATETFAHVPFKEIERLANDIYSSDAWNLKF